MNQPLILWPLVLTPWKIIGLTGTILFASRWFVQMHYSRKAGRPVTPKLFWYMSVVGSLMCLAYFLFSAKQDSVGILQNLFPAGVAVYNLYLESKYQKKVAAEQPPARPEPAAARPSRRLAPVSADAVASK